MFDLPPADPPTPAPATAIIGTAWAAPANPHPLVPAAQAILVDPRIASGVATMIAEAPDPREVPANQQGDLQRAVLGSAAAEKFSKISAWPRCPPAAATMHSNFSRPESDRSAWAACWPCRSWRWRRCGGNA